MQKTKVKILMVCLGNICRSPLAEGILKSKLDSNRYLVNSSGTASFHIGKLPDSRSISVAEKHGINIRNQRASQFSQRSFEIYDYIFVMDKQNYKDVIALAVSQDDKSKVSLILNQTTSEGIDLEVPDPYYGGDEGFDNVFFLLNKACEAIADRV